MRAYRNLVVAMLLGFLTAPPAIGQDAMTTEPPIWKAGVATTVITPDVPMWMAGYASRDRPAEGKLHDLKAKALAFEDPNGARAVVLTVDLVGIDRATSSAVCESLKSQHDLPRKAIFIATSHTHSGPVTGNTLRPTYQFDESQRRLVDEYTRVLKDRLVDVAGAALAKLAPAELSWGNGQVTLAVNRRENRESDVPELRRQGRLQGPVDHDVPVLAVRDQNGSLLAVLFGYACHATVLSGYEWSGDYPGFAQLAIEKAHPGATALFFAGCGADQNPLPRRTVALAESYGNTLADGVNAVLNSPMASVTGELACGYREIDLPFASIPTREELEQTATGSNRYEVARAKLLLSQLDSGESIRTDYPYPIQVWQLGDLTLVTLGGEVVVGYSLRLKRLLGRETTWVAGYANDVLAYIPTEKVLDEGGYEGGGAMVYYGHPSPWAPGIEEAIVKATSALVDVVRGDAKSEREPTGVAP